MKRGDLIKTIPGWCSPQRTGIILCEEASGDWVEVRWSTCDGIDGWTCWQPVRKLEHV